MWNGPHESSQFCINIHLRLASPKLVAKLEVFIKVGKFFSYVRIKKIMGATDVFLFKIIMKNWKVQGLKWEV